MVLSVYKVILDMESDIDSIEVKADDFSVEDNGDIKFWIGADKCAYFRKECIKGFYEIREEKYTPLED